MLGITFDRDDNSDYVSTGDLDGLKHMGLWKLSDAAEACFGTSEWPSDIPVPQATVEFDVDDVEAAAEIATPRATRSCTSR